MVSRTCIGYGGSLASGANLHGRVAPNPLDVNPESPSGWGGPAGGVAVAREAGKWVAERLGPCFQCEFCLRFSTNIPYCITKNNFTTG